MCGASFAAIGARVVGAQPFTPNPCTQYATFTALGEADAVQTVVAAPGVTLVDSVDAELPGAQAEVDSLAGSTGWAGAPYSGTVAGNVGALSGLGLPVNVTANQLPIFATSDYPHTPAAHNATAFANLHASSSQYSSNSSVAAAGPSAGPLTLGQITTKASASCASDGTLHGTASGGVDGFQVAGVLKIGAISSTADAITTASGRQTLTGTMSLAGVTIGGQPVSITDRGVVVGPSAVALPNNPVLGILAAAGITIHYLTVTKDPASGTVTAPGLEISVESHPLPGVGTGVATTTFTFGRAMAVASQTGGLPPGSQGGGNSRSGGGSSPTPVPATSPQSSNIPSSSGSSGPLLAGNSGGTSGPSALPISRGSQPVALGATRSVPRISYLVNASMAGIYSALGAAALVLLLTFIIFGTLGVKLRWR